VHQEDNHTSTARREVMAYCSARPEFFPQDLQMTVSRDGGCSIRFHVQGMHRHAPHVIKCIVDNGDINGIHPYYRIQERPDRQIVSYLLGRERCNLAEVREIADELYSRAAWSISPAELPHQSDLTSRIGLWVHDCLTEDLDHGKSLNRASLPCGTCVSYDFGMAFSSRYYPPFYAHELGLSDSAIAGRADFVMNLLADYAALVESLQKDENRFIRNIQNAFPTTHRESLCRYYVRNFTSRFPERLFWGRFFEKLKHQFWPGQKMEPIARAAGLELKKIHSWTDWVRVLRTIKPPMLDLRGFDFSGTDLRRADLRGTDLREANLCDADLSGADLRNAVLRGAETKGLNLDEADIRQTQF
jgi:hypothetical protein